MDFVYTYNTQITASFRSTKLFVIITLYAKLETCLLFCWKMLIYSRYVLGCKTANKYVTRKKKNMQSVFCDIIKKKHE